MPDGTRQQKQIAYSRIEIKSVNDGARTFEGIASTPSPDRMDDVVVPMGAKFTLPLPLLWQHDAKSPVGHITEARATKDGITVKGTLMQVAEPASLKDDLDRAWAMLKSGLVRGLSIGFMPIKAEPIDQKNPRGGTKFLEWDWFELSLVTIPANAEASILAIKSADQSQRAASGASPRAVVRLSSPPGASGKPAVIPKELNMKPIAEHISALEAKRAATHARNQAIIEKTVDEGRTPDDAESQELTINNGELKAIDDSLVIYKAHEATMVAGARVVNNQQNGNATVAVQRHAVITDVVPPKLEKGQEFGRWALAMGLAKGNVNEANIIVQSRWKDSRLAQVSKLAASIGTADFFGHFGIEKTAVTGGDTTTSGWASQLAYAQNVESEFIEYLRPRTVLGRIDAAVPFRRVPFNFRTGSMTGGTTGNWVGQGAPVPVSKPTTSSDTLGITKVAGLTVVTDELLRLSSPSVEMLLRDDLAAACAYLIDTSFLDPNQGGVANVRPASVTYSVTANQASGTDYAAVKTDVKAAFSGMIAANQGLEGAVWVMSGTTALAMSLMLNAVGQKQFDITPTGGTFMGAPVVVSQAANITGSPDYGNMLVLVFPREIFLADDGSASIEVSNQASIEMLDNPTNNAQAGTATSMVSMFQTNSVAIKAVRPINWKVRGTRTAVGLIRTAAYV